MESNPFMKKYQVSVMAKWRICQPSFMSDVARARLQIIKLYGSAIRTNTNPFFAGIDCLTIP